MSNFFNPGARENRMNLLLVDLVMFGGWFGDVWGMV
jgi:hypothetical protein